VDQEPDRQAFAEALSATLRHHDGLRSRFIRSSDGWRAYIAPSEEHDIVEVHDISGLTPEKEILTARRIGDAVQKSLDLESGPLVRAALLSRGPNRPGMVLIGMHHLVTDVLSAQIFMEDLETAYGQLSRGEHVSLPSKTSSVQEWARKLTEYASSEAVQGELAYWLTPAHAEVGKLPVDFESEATMDTLRTVRLRMPAEDTQLMFRAVAAMSGTDVQDVLITGLAQALAEWTGTSSVALDIHTHGREDLFAGVDVSRTIGWFTVIFPMLLDLRGVATPLDALAAVKHQLRQVPRRGIGYDVLRYMSPDQQVRSLMSAVPRPQVRFNYVTRLSGVNRQGRIFSTIGPVRGPQLEQKASAYRLLEVSTSMARDHFTVDIQYSAAVHSEQTAARVGWMYLRALKQLTESALQPVI
jgi:non-ribosomal peptide synthase protein (TIGR01720 family)